MKPKFVPDTFIVPKILKTDRFLLRMLKADDVNKDYEAIMSSVTHLKKTPTPPRCGDWPSEDLTIEENLGHLKRHEEEHKSRKTFTYTILNLDETKCLGCIYFFPSTNKDFEVEIYFWVTKEEYDKGLENELFGVLKNWIRKEWPFKKISFPNRE